MIWEKIREIEQKEYTKYTQVFYEDADIETVSQKVNSLKEFIALKYTQCVVWDIALNSPNLEDDRENSSRQSEQEYTMAHKSYNVIQPQQVFLKRLDELNNAIFSRFWDDSDCDEKIFYYFALLNFKTHQYDKALRLLNKSLKQEALVEVSKQNAVLRLHKRCLRAYCLEYLGLSANTEKRRELLGETIEFLIGYNVLLTTDKDANEIIIKVLKCAEEYNDLLSIIETLSSSETSCVFNILEQYNSEGFIDEKVYHKYLIQIAHILSHCLSEIRACVLRDASYQTQLRNKDLYQKQDQKQAILLRIAEKLMSILGDDYITCYATLKTENGGYFSSIEILNTGREKLLRKLKEAQLDISDGGKDDSIKIFKRQIAQIDFYCWYFSIFSREQIKQVIADKSKKRFLEYSRNTGDSIANAYYNVVNMKEILLKAFEGLRRNGRVSDKDKKELAEAYEEFMSIDLHYSIHTVISDEWKFLKESYSILQLCCDINTDKGDAKNIELSFYNLYSRLFELYNSHCSYIPNEECERRSKEAQYHTFTLSCGGQLVYRGDYEKFLNAAECNNICFSTYVNKSGFKDFSSNEKTKETLFSQLPKDTSNIVIAVDNDTYEEDLSFIELIVRFDSRETSVDRHNIFVDISSLTTDKQTIFCDQLREMKNKYSDFSIFCAISNLKSVVLLGCVFSILERHLLRLSTPLNSYVISPIDEDIAFDAQSCEKLILLEKSDFGDVENINWRNISDWGYSFGSCFPNKAKISKSSKVLLLGRIRECADSIGYVFYFEAGENGGVSCHAFDVQSNKSFDNRAYIFSDTIKVGSNKQKNKTHPHNIDHDIIVALSNLYRTLRQGCGLRITGNFHKECDKSGECFNLFTFANEDSSKHYKALREYLYSYMGILLEKSVFLLLRDGSVYTPQRWVLFTLPQEKDRTSELQQALCGKLCDVNDYIKDERDVNIRLNCSNNWLDSKKGLDELIKEIKPCPKDKSYYFISYKSKLCEPVYKDVSHLQNEVFKDKYKLDVAIDVKNFTDKFDQEIEEYIKNKYCVGAFVYVSFDYMCPMRTKENGEKFLLPAEQDKCFKEVDLLLKREKEDKNFKIFPIFIKTTSQRENGCGETLKELIQGAFKIYRDAISKSNDRNGNTDRINSYIKLFSVSENCGLGGPVEQINRICYDRKDDFSHFKENNVKTALKDYKIQKDE